MPVWLGFTHLGSYTLSKYQIPTPSCCGRWRGVSLLETKSASLFILHFVHQFVAAQFKSQHSFRRCRTRILSFLTNCTSVFVPKLHLSVARICIGDLLIVNGCADSFVLFPNHFGRWVLRIRIGRSWSRFGPLCSPLLGSLLLIGMPRGGLSC